MWLKRIRLGVWLVCAGVGFACGWPVAHRTDATVYGGPPPDSVANRHSCGRWMWLPPRNGRMLVDISPTANDTTTNGATLAARVRAAGGQVVYVFAVARVRAEIDLDRALALTGEVTIVRDRSRLDVPVVVSLDAPLSRSDSLRLARAGARWTSRATQPAPPRVNDLFATVPDSVVPLLRQDMRAWVHPLGAVCAVE